MDNINLKYLRERKSECFVRAYETYADRTGSLHLHRPGAATLSPLGQKAGVTGADDLVIDDCDYCVRIGSGTAGKTSGHFTGHTLYGGYFRSSWGHFLMNTMARLWPLFTGDGVGSYDRIVFFSESEKEVMPRANFAEMLALLGIADKVVILPCRGSWSFEDLTFGDIAFEIGRYVSREFLMPFDAAVRKALEGKVTDAPKQRGVIIGRSRWRDNERIQRNCRQLERIFTDSGYTVIYPEECPLTELIAAMNGVNEVVSFSGSTAHNMLFARDTSFCVLERCGANNLYQTGIFRLLGVPTVLVDCFYQPMIVSGTDNLTIYAMTEEMRRFCTDRGYDATTFSDDRRRDFRNYLRVYRRHYGYGCGLNDWEADQLPAVAEAYFASRRHYTPFLSRAVPVLWQDILSPRLWGRRLRLLLRGLKTSSHSITESACSSILSRSSKQNV